MAEEARVAEEARLQKAIEEAKKKEEEEKIKREEEERLKKVRHTDCCHKLFPLALKSSR